MSSLGFGLISADSHIVEPGNCYTDYIDPKFRDRAPTIQRDATGNDIYVIPGMTSTIPLGLVAAAGLSPEALAARRQGCTFDQLHKSGYDAKYRVADQDRDGVVAEIIYPSVGMALCNHPDFAYKTACMHAYNEWLANYLTGAPAGRLFGLGQTSCESVEQTLKDMEDCKKKGFVGIMMPGNPQHKDYDDPMYDALWECAADLGLPLSFHILTSKGGSVENVLEARGNKINGFLNIIRGVQDVLGLFVLGGVFERFPKLKFIAAEADAGWLPHYAYRMDHAYNRHGLWLGGGKNLAKMPSDYINSNVWLTFQDDWVAFKVANLMNPKRLVWANDFPHSDATWPWSQEMLEKHTGGLTSEQMRWIMRENIIECYNLPVDKIPA
ncbi:MAG: amidohydrolase family protein [Gammaproteobacteria bacterium]|nr:amidohydrolase family protein [Gammaproteobacteria bacterium]MBK9426510.1 amidohydrolase family protein [Gammaproteobacteria bacterium]